MRSGYPADHFGNDVDEVGWIEPGAAQLVELFRGCGDAFCTRVGGVVFGGDVGREALRKGKVSKVVVGV